MLEEREGVLELAGGRRIGPMTRGVPGGVPVGYLHGAWNDDSDLERLLAAL